MFVVFSLPRSRSAWLAAFLGGAHDIGAECATPEDFARRFSDIPGTCETGAAFAWPLIKRLLEGVRVAVVRRPVDEVCASLRRLGFQAPEAEMMRRAADLERISAEPGVLTVDYADLRLPAVCGGLYAHCLGEAMDLAHWDHWAGFNVQVDIGRQIERLNANRAKIEALKAEVARRLAPQGYCVRTEPWSDAFWTEAEPLAKAHFEEVDGGVEACRALRLDLAAMQRFYDNGVLRLIAARLDGRLVGYFTWNVMLDVESQGLVIAQQGAWYIEPGHPRLMARMWDASVAELKAAGVAVAYPHHRLQGRGVSLGKFFQRRGAKPTQITYSLGLGEG